MSTRPGKLLARRLRGMLKPASTKIFWVFAERKRSRDVMCQAWQVWPSKLGTLSSDGPAIDPVGRLPVRSCRVCQRGRASVQPFFCRNSAHYFGLL